MLVLSIIVISGLSIFLLIRPPKDSPKLVIEKQIIKQEKTIYDNSVAELTP